MKAPARSSADVTERCSMRWRAAAVRHSTTMNTSSAGKSRLTSVPARSPLSLSRCRPAASQSHTVTEAATMAASMHARTRRDRGRINGCRRVAAANTVIASR